ncbi:glycosyltransferase [Sphingobacterium lactis]|uniref:Glycosyltransferase involved in cell wall bisynthesis n=1 Tax=Sphingobacterium lactis TaxID=797291 RepID=A0A1H6BJG3_9SPHI|nr:glycosyltransferase [Sphingobacterium lactis]SEG60850.1 Glycosyltransferase involved in cell wall bisynthesis [Sphingobacterium lactis]
MPTKVLHVVTRIDTGGISTFLSNYYKFIDKSKVLFDIVAIDTGNEQEYHSIFQKQGVGIFYMPNPINQRAVYLYNLIRKNKYDVVHSHIELQSAIYLTIAKVAGVKKRISHAHLSRANLGMKNMFFRKLLNNVSTHKFGASDLSIRAVYGDKEIKNSLVINNAVDTDYFTFNEEKRNSLRKDLGLKSDEIVLGFVGRISALKNIFYLNKIIHEAYTANLNIKLLVIGVGELHAEMEQDLKDKNLLHLVHFLGNRKDVNELMMALDILLLPSFSEGLPLVLVESQSTCLKSLVSNKVTRMIKITDYIEYLGIDDDNLRDWTERIAVLNNSYFRGEPVKKLITEKKFNIAVEVKKLENIYLG